MFLKITVSYEIFANQLAITIICQTPQRGEQNRVGNLDVRLISVCTCTILDGIDLIKVLHCKKEKGCLKSTNASEREVKDSSELFELAGKNKLDVVIDLAPFGNPVTGKILQSALSNGIDCVLANKAPLVYSYHLLKKLSDTWLRARTCSALA